MSASRKMTRAERARLQREGKLSPAATAGPVKKREESRSLHLSLALIVAALGFVLYLNSIDAGYTLDDFSSIKENRVTQMGLKGIPIHLKTSYRYGYWSADDELYRPLSLMMFAAEWHFFPDNPQVYHFINVLLYSLTGFLLFYVLARIFREKSLLLPFIASLLFIAHPVHTEVVASIKSRDEILSFLFGLLSIRFVFSYLGKQSAGKLFMVAFCYFLSLLSKESTITFLAVVPLLLYFFTGTSLARIGTVTGIFGAGAVIYIVIRLNILSGIAGDGVVAFIDNVIPAAPDYASRLATCFMVLAKYLRLLFLPHPLVYDYSFQSTVVVQWSDARSIAGLVLYGALAFYCVRNFRKKDPVVFGILFYFITISLVSNILLTIGSNMAERFLYLPSLGFCIVIAALAIRFLPAAGTAPATLIRWLGINRKPLTLTGMLVLLYGAKTMARNPAWESDYILYSTDVKTSPESARIHYNLGLAMVKQEYPQETDPAKKEKWLEEGLEELKEAVRLYPAYSDAHNQMGVAYHHQKKYDQAIECYEAAMKLKPHDANTFNNLGSSYFSIGRYHDAIAMYQKAIQVDPHYGDAYMNLGSTYGTLKEYKTAIDYFLKAAEYKPDNPQIYFFLSETYKFMGDQQNAALYGDKFNRMKQGARN